jgi:hypothetical protein
MAGERAAAPTSSKAKSHALANMEGGNRANESEIIGIMKSCIVELKARG